ncbi:MAG: TIGR02221 family CRISPR-associated protein [Candidatus Anstonellales archaeon]
MVLLSFLGKGDYQEVTYFIPGENKEFKTKFFLQALNEFYAPSKIIVYMTEEAERKYDEELRSKITFEKKRICEGKTIEELWNNFEIISESIPNDEAIIIDITHAFRSIPIIALSVITFLRVLNNINVEKILYGAFEAKNFYNGKAPIFDITSFLHLIEWSYATDEFLNFGNAKRLREIMDNIHNKSYKETTNTKSVSLKSLGKNLDKITTALAVVRPSEVVKNAKELPRIIEKVKIDLENLPDVKPLSKLLNILPENFKIIADAEGNLFDSKGFKAQAEMINFYIQIKQFQQAITLARESIVSYLCCQDKLNPFDRNEREKVETILNEWVDLSRKGIMLNEKSSRFAELWAKIINCRNDINHAGMRKEPSSAEQLIKNIIDVCNRATELLLNF